MDMYTLVHHKQLYWWFSGEGPVHLNGNAKVKETSLVISQLRDSPLKAMKSCDIGVVRIGCREDSSHSSDVLS